MVLAYEDEEGNKRKTKKRKTFEKNLKEQGLQLETELKTVSNIFCLLTLIRGNQPQKKLYKFAFV